jgi:hypothetical protein
VRRLIIAFFSGLLLASLYFVFLVFPRYAQEKAEFWKKQGEISTKLELMDRVAKTLGDDFRGSDGYNTFLVPRCFQWVEGRRWVSKGDDT